MLLRSWRWFFAVLAIWPPLAATFAPTLNQRQLSVLDNNNVAFVPQSSTASVRRGAMSMDLSDLERKLFEEPKPIKKSEAAKPASLRADKAKTSEKPKKQAEKTKKGEKPKVEKSKKAVKKGSTTDSEPLRLRLLLKGQEEARNEMFKPSNTGVSANVKYELPRALPTKLVTTTSPPTQFVAPKFEAPKLPSFSLPASKPGSPKSGAPSQTDPNAIPIGLSVGAAPLLLAPLALLGASRDALARTKERREKIQQEIAAAEAAKLRRLVQADIDGEAAAGATVSRNHTFL